MDESVDHRGGGDVVAEHFAPAKTLMLVTIKLALSYREETSLAWEMDEEAGPDGKRRYTVAQIAAEFGVTRPTIYRHLSKATPTS